MEVYALDIINKSYSEKSILNNFSLKVYKNDLLCITGKSGSGKSTLDKLGLDVPLNKKIFQLSDREQQRVAIARLFIKNCEIILADESTGSLDKSNRNIKKNK